MIKINRLGLARLGAYPGQGFTVHQPVDQRGFPYVAFPRKCKLYMGIFRYLARMAADCFQIHVLNYHFYFLSRFSLLPPFLWLLFPPADSLSAAFPSKRRTILLPYSLQNESTARP